MSPGNLSNPQTEFVKSKFHSKDIEQRRCKFLWVRWTGSTCRVHLKQESCSIKPWIDSLTSDTSLWQEKFRIKSRRGMLIHLLLPFPTSAHFSPSDCSHSYVSLTVCSSLSLPLTIMLQCPITDTFFMLPISLCDI